MSSLDYLDLCRLCLVKDQVSVSIFDDGESKSRHIYPKIVACLSVKVDPEDKLPKKICDGCAYKLDLFYDFYNTTATAEKQLWMWLEGIGLEDKQNYIANDMNSSLMKQEQGENRLNVAQASAEHQNMSLNMIDNMGLTMPIIMSPDQAISVPISSSETVQTVQSIAGPSLQSQMARKEREDDEETTEDDNTEDEIDHDEGLPVKEEHEDGRIIEPTTFVNVTAMACDEAGPSGLQQKLPEMTMQAADVDPKSGCIAASDHEYSKPKSHLPKCETVQTLDDSVDDIVKDVATIKTSGEQRNGREYKCEVCEKVLRKKQQYRKHVQTHESAPGRCTQCDKHFSDGEKLRKHMIKAHQEDRPFTCILCGKSFKTEEYLRTHLKQHNKRFTCDICGIAKVSGYDLRLHKKKHNKEYVIHCEICNKGFYTNQTLERHVLTHTGEKPFVCRICGTPYSSAAYLTMHLRSHGEREKHKCSLCDFESYWKNALKVHMKIHTGENQISCDICGKSVSSKTYLQIHMRIHSGEKPHVCERCGKAFSVRKYLVVHLRTHTGERPYQCKICEKKFTQQGSLNSHMKCHQVKK